MVLPQEKETLTCYGQKIVEINEDMITFCKSSYGLSSVPATITTLGEGTNIRDIRDY